MASPFNINFDIRDYADVLPELPTDYSEILNSDIQEIDDQHWRRIPEPRDKNGKLIITQEFLLQETKKIRQGVWMMNKGVPLWLPGTYYSFLQYGNAMGRPPEFRLKKLKQTYHDLIIINDPRLMGDAVTKNRKDGETMYKMWSSLIYPFESGLTHGAIGMQSKDNLTVYGSCWTMLKSHLAGLPRYFKDAFLSEIVDETKIEQKIRFERKKNDNVPDDYGMNIIFDYRSCVFNAYDSGSDIRIINLDEYKKWEEDSILATLTNYKNFIFPGFERKGIFRLFSSPADKAGKHNDEAHTIWKQSDPKNINPKTGTTYNRLLRYYSCPLDGIEKSYDKFGDADPQRIYDHIMGEREGQKGKELLGLIRAFPMPIKGTFEPNEEEMFGATDDSGVKVFMNSAGIKKQVAYVKEKQEILNQYGNYEWPNNVEFSGIPVFRVADVMDFNDETARFCRAFSNIPRIQIIGDDIKKPPPEGDTQGVIGIDPFNNVHRTKNPDKQSMGAAIPWMFRNFSGYGITDANPDGINDMPIGAYLSRPWHKKIFYDDMVKYAIATGFRIQHEDSDNEGLWEYFTENGMQEWLIDSRSGKFIETPHGTFKRKGDAPSGRGAKAFTTELKNLIDGITNVPYNDTEPYLLTNFNIYQVLEDLLKLDLTNTQDRHFSMALGQALLGRGKLLTRRIIKPSAQMDEAMSVLFS